MTPPHRDEPTLSVPVTETDVIRVLNGTGLTAGTIVAVMAVVAAYGHAVRADERSTLVTPGELAKKRDAVERLFSIWADGRKEGDAERSGYRWQKAQDALTELIASAAVAQEELAQYFQFVEAGAIGGCPRCPTHDGGSAPCSDACSARLTNEVAADLAFTDLAAAREEIDTCLAQRREDFEAGWNAAANYVVSGIGHMTVREAAEAYLTSESPRSQG